MPDALHTTVETFLVLLLIVFVVAALVQRIRLPYTIALVAVGFLGLRPSYLHAYLTPDLILLVFLPVLLWGGLRGAVSLALVLSIPLALPNGQAFPDRELLQVMAFGVVGASLLLQGLTMAPLLRRLGLQTTKAQSDGSPESVKDMEGETELLRAAGSGRGGVAGARARARSRRGGRAPVRATLRSVRGRARPTRGAGAAHRRCQA